MLSKQVNSIFSAAVPIWGQTILIPSDLSPKRDWGPKRVEAIPARIGSHDTDNLDVTDTILILLILQRDIKASDQTNQWMRC